MVMAIVRWLLKMASSSERENLAYELVRDECISAVLAEKIIVEVIKDQGNRVISFTVKG